MSKFEQKLCFGLLQLKKTKKVYIFWPKSWVIPFEKISISPFILSLVLKCTKIVSGDVLDREKNVFRLLKDIYLIKLENWIFRNGFSHDFDPIIQSIN